MVPVLVGIAVLALAGVAVVALRRRAPSTPPIDPFTVGEPWRRHVAAALAAQRRYRELVGTTEAGPLREHLVQIGTQVANAVDECYQIARAGDDLDQALDAFDTPSLTARAERATDDATKASLQAQLDSAGRIRTTRNDTDAKLSLLTTRMGELVAQAAEVSVGTITTDDFGTNVGDVVTELEALRLAIADVNRTGRVAG
jgi:hypothetical protein